MGIVVHVTNNCPQVMKALENAKERALLSCGSNAEGHAKDECPVDTGNLRNSISHEMADDDSVEIGTNCEYALYVECGTGQYSTLGNGTSRKSWSYMGEDGEWHMGFPQRARPYIKPAVANHSEEYRNLITDSFKNA